MKVWFLRIKHPEVNRSDVIRAKLAPILFAKVPLSACRLGLDEERISALVKRIYKDQKPRARRAHAGTLRRFLSDATEGDFVGIKVNREEMIFGQFVEGEMRPFSELENDGVKGRPFRMLTRNEIAEVRSLSLPDSVKTYRGTFCNWLTDEIDLPDKSEKQRRNYYSSKASRDHRQIKFIRVGADLGCGQRLSRIFPGNFYHFIPIPKHNDPEFCRFTYGDGAARKDGSVATKGRSLMNLRRDDVLVFYAGFAHEGSKLRRLIGIFG